MCIYIYIYIRVYIYIYICVCVHNVHMYAVHVLASLRLSWQRSCSTRLRVFWSSVFLSLVISLSSSWSYEDRLAWNSLRSRVAFDQTRRTEIVSHFFISVLHLIKDSIYFYVPRSVRKNKEPVTGIHITYSC